MLTLQVKEKNIENLTPDKEFIRGTVGAECQIDLDEFWQGYENTVVFKRENDCTVYNVAIDSLSNRVEIPYTILAESGSFKVGLFGVKPDEVLPTLWSDYIKVRYGTDTHGTTPPQYEPNEIDQLRLSKQDKLIAGDGISISENNVISATGGSGTVDDVQVNGESVVDEGVANILIDQTYNETSENAQSGKAIASALSGYYNKAEADEQIGALQYDVSQVANNIGVVSSMKQDKLTAGANITISYDNVISAVGVEPIGITLLSTTITESTNSIECDIQGCNKIYIFGSFKKATANGNVTIDAYFGNTIRDVARANGSVSATASNIPFAFFVAFGIPTGNNSYISYSNCGSSNAIFKATSQMRKTYAGKIPDKITINCSSEFAVNSSIDIIGVKSNG